MTAINLPGFTGEASLYGTGTSYRGVAALRGAGAAIQPVLALSGPMANNGGFTVGDAIYPAQASSLPACGSYCFQFEYGLCTLLNGCAPENRACFRNCRLQAGAYCVALCLAQSFGFTGPLPPMFPL
jgi:hypothetical protein